MSRDVPSYWQQLANKMEEDHQLTIQVIQYENVVLQVQRNVYQT